jgi:uncharacterized membrane protein YhaH (DUF805 family)
MNYMFMPLRRYFDFEGRSRRKEFWLWQLFIVIVMSVLIGGFMIALTSAIARVDARGGLDRTSSYDSSYGDSSYGDTSMSYSGGGVSYGSSSQGNMDPQMFMEEMGTGGWIMLALGILFALATFIPNLAVTIRRFHDQDKSGFFYFLAFIPFVGGIILLVFMCLEGTRGPNRFGPDPKGADVSRTFA